MTAGYAECFHCLQAGHWQDDCPLLIPAASRKQHEQRIAEFTRRLGDGEIGPVAKRKMIEKENAMWKAKQKEMARK